MHTGEKNVDAIDRLNAMRWGDRPMACARTCINAFLHAIAAVSDNEQVLNTGLNSGSSHGCSLH